VLSLATALDHDPDTDHKAARPKHWAPGMNGEN